MAKKNLLKLFGIFLAIALIATALDFGAHELLNPFFEDDTSRPVWYYAAKVVAFVIAFATVDFFFIRFIKIPRSIQFAIYGTLYFAVYYVLVAPSFVLPSSAIVLTLLHAVFIFIGAKLLRVK